MRSLLKYRKAPLPGSFQPVQAEAPDLHNAAIAAVYYGQRRGGDFYDFVRVAPNRVVFGLLDVAGIQEENREIVAAAQMTFREGSCELFSAESVNEADAMIELCLRLNRTILSAAGRVCPCPAFAGCFEEELGTVCYFSAGHIPGLVRDASGLSELPATGLPLGLFSHSTCDASVVALAPGAALLLVSRGVIEARRKTEDYGWERVRSSFQSSGAESAKEICISVLAGVHDFMGTPPTHNDVTALALLRDGIQEN